MGINDHFGTDAGVSFVAFLKAEGTVIPEIAFPYLAASLRGHDLRFFDGARLDEDRDGPGLGARIADFQPDWAVVSTSLANLVNEARFAAGIRELTEARVVLFGHAAHCFAVEILAAHAIDFVVDGEVEAVVPDLIESQAPDLVPGVWRLEEGKASTTGTRLVEDLDALPFPDWSVTPMDRYNYFPLLKKRPFATMSSSRGCTYGCHFCPYFSAQGHRFRKRDPERIVDELSWLSQHHGVRSVLFRDPNFAIDRDRVLAICQGIVDRGIPVDWGCETRLDLLDDEVIRWFGRSRCRSVEFGMDTVAAGPSRRHNRRTIGHNNARERIRTLNAHGVASAALFLVGLPGDTHKSIVDTIRFANSLDLTYINYEIPVPFPGTVLYNRAVDQGVMAPLGLDDLDGTNPRMPDGPSLPHTELLDLQSRALRSFYIRPRRVLQTLSGGEAIRSAGFLGGAALRFLSRRFRGDRDPH